MPLLDQYEWRGTSNERVKAQQKVQEQVGVGLRHKLLPQKGSRMQKWLNDLPF